MRVEEIMTREVVSVRPDTPVGTVARLMCEKEISGVPVVDAAGDVVGIVTEADIIARHARPHFPAYLQFLDNIIYLESSRRYRESIRHILATTAGELMTTPARMVRPEMEVQDLAALMVDEHLNPVPVVDDQERLVGIVSRADLVRVVEQVNLPDDDDTP